MQQNDPEIGLIQEEIERLSLLDPDLAGSYQEQLVQLQRGGAKTDTYEITLAEIEALWAEADLLIEREVPTQEVLDTTYAKSIKDC